MGEWRRWVRLRKRVRHGLRSVGFINESLEFALKIFVHFVER